jgi:cholesterol oxidase
MRHDSASGVMKLKNDRVRVEWPGAEREAIYAKIQQTLIEVTRALGGEFVPNPIQEPPLNDLITVHALGGCNMAEDATRGVVNHRGQVFSGSSGTVAYDGLYVADGAVIPTAIGTNPLLTISGIAERNAALIARDLGKTIDYSLPSAPAAPPEADTVGIQFTETMTGWLSKSEKDDYHKAATQARKDDSPFRFVLDHPLRRSR